MFCAHCIGIDFTVAFLAQKERVGGRALHGGSTTLIIKSSQSESVEQHHNSIAGDGSTLRNLPNKVAKKAVAAIVILMVAAP